MQITEGLSEAKASGAKISETKADLNKSWNVRPKNISEEDMLEFIGSWQLLSIYALAEIPGNSQINPEIISARVGISRVEASSYIETLVRIGALEQTGRPGHYKALPLVIDDYVVVAADLLSNFNRLSQVSKTKLTSKDCFGHIFESMNRKVILKYLPEIYSLIQKIKDESKDLSANEVYAFEFSFTKATRTPKSELL